MTHSLVGPLPRHIYCFVDSSFVRKGKTGFEPCVWFGLVSYPGRAWGLTVMLECGAVYRNLPPHAVAFEGEPGDDPQCPWGVREAQVWDCYGRDFTVLEYPYLSGLRLAVRYPDWESHGDYLFTAAPVGDGFSAEPGQAKEFTFCRLDNSRLTIQPTNRVLFVERSFTDGSGWPTDLKRQEDIYSCEE